MRVCTASDPQPDSLLFVTDMTDEVYAALCRLDGCTLLLHEKDKERCDPLAQHHTVKYSDNPRYAYAEVMVSVRRYPLPPDNSIHPDALVMPGAYIGDGVTIGAGAVIGPGAVIGAQGFGIATHDSKPPLRIPHVGGVTIGDHVEIGACATVSAGTINPTVIGAYSKIDDHAHIAHNVQMGRECIVTGCAEVSGSVTIGDRAWLGPNCAILEGLTIGADSLVGIGAVVMRSVEEGATVAGNPARQLTPRRVPDENEVAERKEQMRKTFRPRPKWMPSFVYRWIMGWSI